ncbi:MULTISPECIES: flagellar protein FlaG [Cupriavidus]|uniref:Flagellar protein FlaG protein n=1 Tax=Cupriavidus pinatubonensis (strain JMP 134 / LMG 1197) TaxID=264198 RepID=Q46QZ6_CUPPJ|nr:MULTISPECIES: flagellar protein FlaG [Cupriavidus]QYY27915.1 flagellar protein FlaG [Cupriavidus pinatubonensis]TPQ41627.1 flagellar biosynthesis protein FlaG [Cupriavidus pinatubonensis]
MASPSSVTPVAVRLPSDVPASTIGVQAPTGVSFPVVGNGQDDSGKTGAAGSVDTSAAVGELVEALKSTSISLRFEIDESTHRVITKVVDKETGELIRQMPTVEVLRIASAIDKLQGLFVSQAV